MRRIPVSEFDQEHARARGALKRANGFFLVTTDKDGKPQQFCALSEGFDLSLFLDAVAWTLGRYYAEIEYESEQKEAK